MIGAIAAHYVAAAPTGDYAAEVLADSPWAFWKLTETTGAPLADASGNSRPISTLVGSPSLAQTGPTPSLPAITFPSSAGPSGSDSYAHIASASFATSRVTFEAWVNLSALPTGGNATPIIACAAGYASGSHDKALFIDSTGRFGWMIYPGGASGVFLRSAAGAATAGVWYHVVASTGAAGSRIRVNKTTVATAVTTASYTGSQYVILHGGGSNGELSVIQGGPASIAAPAIYTTQLSDARTDAHYDAAFA